MAITALLVAVPEAEDAVGRWRRDLDPSAAHGLPAHVTVLVPFVDTARIDDATRAALAGIFSTVPAFDVSFARCDRFDGPVLFLAPEPARPFVEMTSLVHRAYPDQPPYGGRFVDVVPHLTVADGAPESLVADVEDDLLAKLPIAARVSEVLLMAHDDAVGRWRTIDGFGLRR